MKFTPEQIARGISTTLSFGDYSLAAQRLLCATPEERKKVLKTLEPMLRKTGEWDIFIRYLPRRD